MNKKNIIFIFLIVAVASVFVLASRLSRKQTSAPTETQKIPQNVTVQAAADSVSYVQTIQYPATVVGDQEIQVTAKSAGTATAANFALGDFVGAGSLLVKVDDVGNKLKTGDNGFQSSEIQQSQLSVEQAEEQLEIAKKTYSNLKDQFDLEKKNPTAPQTVTKTQKDNAKEAIDLAEIQLESQKVGFKGALYSHLITSPIAGYVTQKSVVAGDSISLGQPLFSISKTTKVKIHFFVNEEQLASVKKGMDISLTNGNGNKIPFVVRNISPQADAVTKRFLIEAYPREAGSLGLFSGTIVSVSFEVTKNPQKSGALILPLSAISIGQNESYLFLAENGKAKKVTVNIINVTGETAEIEAAVTAGSEIIIQGSKLIQDGEEISISR